MTAKEYQELLQQTQKKRRTKTPENILKAQVKEYLDLKGWFHFPVSQGMGSHPGIADRIAIKNGRVVFIECKAPGHSDQRYLPGMSKQQHRGVQSTHQEIFEQNVKRAGGEYILAYSVDDLRAAGV